MNEFKRNYDYLAGYVDGLEGNLHVPLLSDEYYQGLADGKAEREELGVKDTVFYIRLNQMLDERGRAAIDLEGHLDLGH